MTFTKSISRGKDSMHSNQVVEFYVSVLIKTFSGSNCYCKYVIVNALDGYNYLHVHNWRFCGRWRHFFLDWVVFDLVNVDIFLFFLAGCSSLDFQQLLLDGIKVWTTQRRWPRTIHFHFTVGGCFSAQRRLAQSAAHIETENLLRRSSFIGLKEIKQNLTIRHSDQNWEQLMILQDWLFQLHQQLLPYFFSLVVDRTNWLKSVWLSEI